MEDLVIINLYMHLTTGSKPTKQKLTELKEETDKPTNIVEASQN